MGDPGLACEVMRGCNQILPPKRGLDCPERGQRERERFCLFEAFDMLYNIYIYIILYICYSFCQDPHNNYGFFGEFLYQLWLVW